VFNSTVAALAHRFLGLIPSLWLRFML